MSKESPDHQFAVTSFGARVAWGAVLLFVCLFALSRCVANLFDTSSGRPMPGDLVDVQAASWACPYEEGFDQALALYEQHDASAAEKSLEQQGCQFISQGIKGGIFSKRSISHSTNCVRVYTEPQCMWFVYTSVERSSAGSRQQ